MIKKALDVVAAIFAALLLMGCACDNTITSSAGTDNTDDTDSARLYRIQKSADIVFKADAALKTLTVLESKMNLPLPKGWFPRSDLPRLLADKDLRDKAPFVVVIVPEMVSFEKDDLAPIDIELEIKATLLKCGVRKVMFQTWAWGAWRPARPIEDQP